MMTNFKLFFSKMLRYLIYYPQDLLKLSLFFPIWYYQKKIKNQSSSQDLVKLVYQNFLKTPITETEINFYTEQIINKNLDEISFIANFLMIPSKIEEKFYQTTGIYSHHLARLKLIQKLPPAEKILDLGGASGSEQGALLEMGYPYQPQEINIIDLPPEARFFPSQNQKFSKEILVKDKIKVRYYYQSMTDLSNFPDSSIDLVWSGQSIEHITEDQGSILLKEIYRILKPQGYFCLDTPNRYLTKLQVKSDFVHPEHKIEYYPEDLITKVTKFGFKIEESLAVSPLPFSLKNQRFSRLELINSTDVDSNVNTGYSFYLKCQKI